MLGAAALFAIGAVIVASHVPAASTGAVSDFGAPPDSAAPYTPPSYASTAQSAPPSTSIVPQTPDTSNPQTVSLFGYESAPATSTVAAIISTDTAFDFNVFMQQLSGTPKTPATRQTPRSSVIDTQEAYPAVPPYLFSATETTAPARSETQEALHTYGNAAGAFVQAYEQAHPDAVAVVQKYFDARVNTANTIALKQLAADIKNIGTGLNAMEDVPAPVAAIHNALANSYIDVGDKLASQTSPQIRTKDDMIKSILSYDDAVETYIKNYDALAQTLAQYGVTFRTDEPGSAFMFSR